MPSLVFPEKLQELLSKDQQLNAWITDFAQKVGAILKSNGPPFFPFFTDHGIDHVEAVLKTEAELVPEPVWEKKILNATDAAVIIGGTLLHDLAMHLHEKGFLELIQPKSRWKPLRWFDQAHEGHAADRPWSDLWAEYEQEARKFSDRVLGNIVGPQPVRDGWRFEGLPPSKEQWNLRDRLVVGEFIRRHHARLAHEVAMYGFPGLEAGSGDHQFPVLAQSKKELADLVGLSARSHGINLRVCIDYLDDTPTFAKALRPMNTAVLYPMALLRVADYLQIEGNRAPAVLLQLKDPQSLLSVKEWQTHKAVLAVTPAVDPAGKMVTVSNGIGLEVFLQLSQLMQGIQREMDHSTAVLEEVYGRCEREQLTELKLKYRRVHSNVNEPQFQKGLPYVPARTGYSSDPNLLPLLVEPLYGAYPGVGVRELMQNAVDAVRELAVWSKSHKKKMSSHHLPKLAEGADVLIDFVDQGDGKWLLKVQDRGIGMTADILQKYFLRAGASFRQSPEWTKQFTDCDGKPLVLRSGKFGIGAFAVFLLGPEFKLITRHAGETGGHRIEAKMDSGLIEIRPDASAKIGTTVEVLLREEAVVALKLKALRADDSRHWMSDWYCQEQPKVVRRIGSGRKFRVLTAGFAKGKAKPESGWMTICPDGHQAVHWTFNHYPTLTCNGIRIASPEGDGFRDAKIEWPFHQILLNRPNIAVDDAATYLPVTTQRYGLLTPKLPFLNELARDVILSFIAHTLILGPRSRIEALSYEKIHSSFPLSEGPNSKRRNRDERMFLNRWISTKKAFVPFDPYLSQLLQSKYLVICGVETQIYYLEEKASEVYDQVVSDSLEKVQCAALKWDGSLEDYRHYPPP